jgi:chlorophyll/bacteriochlorophyll a synthase
LAVGLSYEGLAWITGAAVLLGGTLPYPPILWIALLYSLGTHGIMTLNDFKSMDGDRRMGIHSLPAALGAEKAAWVSFAVMVLAQFAVILTLGWRGHVVHAIGVASLLILQVLMLTYFLAQPRERALWYSGFGVPLFVLGMMVSAFALRGEFLQ